MLFKSTMVVLGAKASKGNFNGMAFDKTTIFYKADLQEGENFVGEVGESMAWGLSDNFQKIKTLEFPLIADVTLEQVSNGSASRMIIKDLVPQKQHQQGNTPK